MNLADTSVLIPTVDRPNYLRTALRSVEAQTHRERISRVRVMENGPGDSSRSVCEEFSSSLPIEYVRRSPQLSPLDHGRLILKEDHGSDNIAILHDDDWWVPTHLENNHKAMAQHKAVAVYSSFFEVNAEASPMRFDGGLSFWFGAGYPSVVDTWGFGAAEMMLSSLWCTPGRYSTLLINARAFRAGAHVCETGNHFDVDRMAGVAYAILGPVAYNPLPGAFIRLHPGQDGRRFTSTDVVKRMSQTTLWIFEQACQARIDLIDRLQQRLDTCPAEYLPQIIQALSSPWVFSVLRGHKRLPKILRDAWRPLEDQLRQKMAPSC